MFLLTATNLFQNKNENFVMVVPVNSVTLKHNLHRVKKSNFPFTNLTWHTRKNENYNYNDISIFVLIEMHNISCFLKIQT